MATNSTTIKLTLKIASFVLKLLVNLFFYIIIVILTINVSKMALDFTYQLYGPVTMEAAPGTEVMFEIQKGDSTMDVASKLENRLLIKNKYAFYLKNKLEKSVIMPGSYTLNTSMTYDDIITLITDNSASVDGEETDSGTDTDTSTSTITE